MKRTTTVLEIFDVEVPDTKNPDVVKRYHFTSAERPVTYNGQQYVPLNTVDAAKWLESPAES